MSETTIPQTAKLRARLPSMQFWLVLIVGVIAAMPLLLPGYFWGAHDARHDVYFIFQYDMSVQDGIWLPRWSPDWTFGYGYPFFIVYGPLATFVGELFHHFLGFGFEESVKAVLALSIVLSGLAMYGFVRSWLGRNAGLVAAVAYMVVPYHLVDVFVRAAMAESVALVFVPLALWGFRECVVRPRWSALIGAALAYAGLMWTSNLVAIVFTPALAIYVAALIFWRARDAAGSDWRGVLGQFVKGAWVPGFAFVCGLSLSAAFFIPALVEQQYINRTQWFGEYYDPTQHFVYFNQLFNPAWGFGISQPGPDDIAQGAMSYQLGAVAVLLAMVAAVAAVVLPRRVRRELWFWALWGVVSVGLTLGVSAWLWQHVPIIPYAQFPWRYLMLAILPLSVLPAALAAPLPWTGGFEEGVVVGYDDRAPSWAAVALAGLLLLGSYPYLRVEVREPTIEQGPVSHAALMRFQRTSDEMTGVTVWVDPAQRPNWSPMAEIWVRDGEVTTRVDYGQVPQTETLAVNSEDMGSAHEQIYFYAKDPGQTITFNWFWYPGWTAYLLDGKDGAPVREMPILREEGPLARIVLPVPAGEGYILLRMEETPLRRAARWITLITIALLILTPVIFMLTRNRRRKVTL